LNNIDRDKIREIILKYENTYPTETLEYSFSNCMDIVEEVLSYLDYEEKNKGMITRYMDSYMKRENILFKKEKY